MGEGCWCELELPLGESVATFDLEKAVCSHGLFMMSPNIWDPLSKTLSRPLRLVDNDDDGDDDQAAYTSASVFVSISHPPSHLHSLLLRVFGTNTVSPLHQQSLLAQVRRMLRLSKADEISVRQFQTKQISFGIQNKHFTGRVFRSPTLFEDMVKCILLCNCQWPRTLSMARQLCDLQLELQKNVKNIEAETQDIISATPPPVKQYKRKLRVPTKSVDKFKKTKANLESEANSDSMGTFEIIPSQISYQTDVEPCRFCKSSQGSAKIYKDDSSNDSGTSNRTEPWSKYRVGNFPSPRELATLDEDFLAKRCKLGYRAGRILKLARAIVQGRTRLAQLEKIGNHPSLDNCNTLAKKLKGIDGFGPFTCANVLMCMGFYHVIPTDSETIRHLKQVQARQSTIRTVQKDIEEIYGKYAPFQFLAYWSELWHFYEKRFGKLSKMAPSDYSLITARNMQGKSRKK